MSDVTIFYQPGQFVGVSQDLDPLNPYSLFRQVIVDKADQVVFQPLVAPQFARHGLARTPGTDDERIGMGQMQAGAIVIGADGKARPPDHKDCQDRIHHKDRTRVIHESVDPIHSSENERGAGGCGLHDVEQIAHSDIPPPSAEQTKVVKHQQLDQQNERQSHEERSSIGFRQIEVQSQKEAEVIGRGQKKGLRKDDDGSAILQDEPLESGLGLRLCPLLPRHPEPQ